MKKQTVVLKPEERKILSDLIASGTAPARKLTHARILLKAGQSDGRTAWENSAQFLGFSLPTAFSAPSLAVELAKRTCFLHDMVAQQLTDERDRLDILTGFYEAFR